MEMIFKCLINFRNMLSNPLAGSKGYEYFRPHFAQIKESGFLFALSYPYLRRL